MHSKWKIWDYLKAHPQLKLEDGINAFFCFDPLAFKLIKSRLEYSQFYESKLNVMLASELSLAWLEDNFKSFGLFGNQDSYLVLGAEDIASEVKSFILDNADEFILDNRSLLLSFNKEEKFFKSLQKHGSNRVHTVLIQSPAFWEEDQLLYFLAHHIGVYLTMRAKDFLKDKLAFSIQNYYQALSQIKINYPNEKEVDIDQIKNFIPQLKFDHFEMGRLFGGKQMKEFYDKLLNSMDAGHELFGLIYFLQSHLQKISDPSYLKKKSRMTKYDKQILSQTKLWRLDELLRAQAYLSDLMILAKKKDDFLKEHLRRDSLKLMRL